MAVTITIAPKYCDMAATMSSATKGGEYKSGDIGNKSNITLGSIGASVSETNLSSACKITKLKLTGQIKASANTSTFKSDITVYFLAQEGAWDSNGTVYSKFDNTAEQFSAKSGDSSFGEFTFEKDVSSYDVSISECGAVGFAIGAKRDDIYSWYTGYAHVKELAVGYTRTRACYITFKGDGVTETKTTYDYGTIPSYGSTPARDGYTFKGWSDGTTTYSALPTAGEQDVTYTAVWGYTVTFDCNGATSGLVNTQSVYIGDSFTLPDSLKRDGYIFLGWYASKDGDTKIGNGGDSYTPSGNITLYSRWLLVNKFLVGTKLPIFYSGVNKVKKIYAGKKLVYFDFDDEPLVTVTFTEDDNILETYKIPKGMSAEELAEEAAKKVEGYYDKYYHYLFGGWKVDDANSTLEKVVSDTKFTASLQWGLHDYNEETERKEPTCTENGSKTLKCICGRTITEEIPAAHTFDKENEEHPYAKTEPTCTEKGSESGYCTACKEVVSVTLEALGHDMVTDKEGQVATCTDDGWTSSKHCTRCEYKKESETIPKMGHKLVEYGAVEQKICTDVGYEAGVKCSRCPYIEKEPTPIPAKEHIDENGDGKCDNCGIQI